MRSVEKYRSSRTVVLTACAACLGASLHSETARAQSGATGESPVTVAPAPVATPPSATSDASATPPAEPAPSVTVPPIELLPPSAYPTPAAGVRGIHGGSLWLEPDLQGMQWPYLPKTAVGISGSGWVDTGYRKFHAGEAKGTSPGLGTQESRGEQFVQQSRFVLRATPTWTIEDKYFVQAQTELVAAQINASTNRFLWSADDAWIRFGMWKRFDVQLGRFQAWEVYHYGMGLDLFTLERSGANDIEPGTATFPDIYGLTYMYLRQDVLGQGAVHLYPFDWLRFEVGFQYGATVTNGSNTDGVRPVAVADFPLGRNNVLRLKAGAEFVDSRGQTTATKFETLQQGTGGAVQVILDPFLEFGGNAAYAHDDTRDPQGRISTQGRFNTYSLGGFFNWRFLSSLHNKSLDDFLVGGGVNYTYLIDRRFDPIVNRGDSYDQLQPYGAIQYLLWNRLFIKGVFAYAVADLNPVTAISNTYRNEMWSARLRILYLL